MKEKLYKNCMDSCLRVRQAYVFDTKEFAKLLGVAIPTLYLYEHGKRTPRIPKIRRYIELAAKKNISLKLEDFFD